MAAAPLVGTSPLDRLPRAATCVAPAARRAFTALLVGVVVLGGCGADGSGNEGERAATTAATAGAPPSTTSLPTTSAAPASAAPTTVAPARTVSLARFQTPTGNIACDAAEGGIRCDIRERTWTPPPKPSNCDVDWGNGLGIGEDGTPTVVCAGDTVLDDSLPKLAYGEVSRVGPIACTSRQDGLTCAHDRTGRGFFLSRQAYRLL